MVRGRLCAVGTERSVGKGAEKLRRQAHCARGISNNARIMQRAQVGRRGRLRVGGFTWARQISETPSTRPCTH